MNSGDKRPAEKNWFRPMPKKRRSDGEPSPPSTSSGEADEDNEHEEDGPGNEGQHPQEPPPRWEFEFDEEEASMAELQERILKGSPVEDPSSEEDEDDLYHVRHLQQPEGESPHMGPAADRVPEEEEYVVEGIVTHEDRLTEGEWKTWFLMKWLGYDVEGAEEDWVCEDDTE